MELQNKMGGAKFMGRDMGVPLSAQQSAFDLFMYWLLGGLIITFGFSAMIFTKLNAIPFVVYFLGLIFFWRRYIKKENGFQKK